MHNTENPLRPKHFASSQKDGFILTLTVLVTTIDAQWEGMRDGGCRVGEVRAGTTSPMPNHKGFKLQ